MVSTMRCASSISGTISSITRELPVSGSIRTRAYFAAPGCFLYADSSASSRAWRSLSSAMPFSRARACMASTISRDICFLLLDQIRTVDVGVRDGDHARGGGDRHLLVRGADELVREALVAVAPVACANASAATEEAAEVGRLRERALDAGRGHLERIALTKLGELMGDALAQVERDAVGMVDEHAERVATDDLGEQHLDLRLGRGKAALDIRLQAAHPSLLPTTKKRASARFLTCAGEPPA